MRICQKYALAILEHQKYIHHFKKVGRQQKGHNFILLHLEITQVSSRNSVPFLIHNFLIPSCLISAGNLPLMVEK